MQNKKYSKINGFLIYIILLNLLFLTFNTILAQETTDKESTAYNKFEVNISNDENHYYISTSNLTISISRSKGQIKYFPVNNEHNIDFIITLDRIELYNSIMVGDTLPEPAYISNLNNQEWYFVENPEKSDVDYGTDFILIMYSTLDLEKFITDGGSTDVDKKSNGSSGGSQPNNEQPPTEENLGKEKIQNAIKLELIFKPVPVNPDEIKIDYQITFLKEIPNSVSIAMVHELKVALEQNYELKIQEMSQNEQKIINQNTMDNRMMNRFSNNGQNGINFVTNGLETGFFSWENEYSVANNKTLNAGYIYRNNLFELYFIYDTVSDNNGSFYGIIHDPELGIYSENFESLQELKEDIQKFVEEHYRSIAAGIAIGVVITSLVVVRAHTIARKNKVSVVRLENNRYYKK